MNNGQPRDTGNMSHKERIWKEQNEQTLQQIKKQSATKQNKNKKTQKETKTRSNMNSTNKPDVCEG